MSALLSYSHCGLQVSLVSSTVVTFWSKTGSSSTVEVCSIPDLLSMEKYRGKMGIRLTIFR